MFNELKQYINKFLNQLKEDIYKKLNDKRMPIENMEKNSIKIVKKSN